MKKLVLVLVLLMAGLWVYGKISEQASTPRYSNSSPRETIQTFFTAIKERDAEGIRCTFDKEGYGMNAMEEIHSYVTPDRKKTYCIYDGPNPEAIRQAAERNGLPVDSIVPVSVLDPYFYNV